MYQNKYDDAMNEAANRLKKYFGENPDDVIEIYVSTTSEAKSNLSGVYSAYIIRNNKLLCLVCNCRVTGGNIDRTFHFAYSIFQNAYGSNPNFPYQTFLKKVNI